MREEEREGKEGGRKEGKAQTACLEVRCRMRNEADTLFKFHFIIGCVWC